jgi:alcohol dehydrogenase
MDDLPALSHLPLIPEPILRQHQIGALSDAVTIDPTWFMLNQITYRGSNWFTTAQGERLAELAQAGLLDVTVFENKVFSLDEANDALALAASRPGGFANVVVIP